MYWEATLGLSLTMKSRISFKSLLASGVNLAVAINAALIPSRFRLDESAKSGVAIH